MVETAPSLEERIREEWVREALKDQFTKYKEFKKEKEWGDWPRWSSHHAQFALITLAKKKKGGRKRERKFVVKKYYPIDTDDPVYSLAHHPDFLYSRELRNLNLIRQITRAGLVPLVYASSDNHHLIIMEHLSGRSYREELIELVQQSESQQENKKAREQLRHHLYKGVQAVARFVGKCNSRKDKFDWTHDGYKQDAETLQKPQQELFKEYLLRAAYLFDSQYDRQRPYQKEEVSDYFEEKGVRLDQRLSDLNKLSQKFETKQKLVHGDLHPDHIRGKKILDLEKFGHGDEVEDISSFCVVTRIGNNRIIESGELGHLLNRYIAFEHAYECQKKDDLKYLEQCNNGVFLEYIGENIDAESYANFTLNFFAYAIKKNIQLAALYERTGNSGGTNPDYVLELFQEVLLLDNTLIDKCSNPKEVREYFHNLGSLISDLGIIQFPNGFLERLKSGTAARDIGRALPKFRG